MVGDPLCPGGVAGWSPRVLTAACPPPTELKATGTAHFFNFLLNTTDYRILLKDEDHDRMYVGSKDYVLSLDLHDINREPLIVRAGPAGGGVGAGRGPACRPHADPRVRRSTGRPPRSASRSACSLARMAT